MKTDIFIKVTNILPKDVVDDLAEYWCDEEDIRMENLGEFIQRCAELGKQYYLINKAFEEYKWKDIISTLYMKYHHAN